MRPELEPLPLLAHHVAGRATVLQCLADIEANVLHAVRRAIDQGYSWADVADVLGTSRQAAWTRYGDPRPSSVCDPSDTRPGRIGCKTGADG
jgi:hypothetical protein